MEALVASKDPDVCGVHSAACVSCTHAPTHRKSTWSGGSRPSACAWGCVSWGRGYLWKAGFESAPVIKTVHMLSTSRWQRCSQVCAFLVKQTTHVTSVIFNLYAMFWFGSEMFRILSAITRLWCASLCVLTSVPRLSQISPGNTAIFSFLEI